MGNLVCRIWGLVGKGEERGGKIQSVSKLPCSIDYLTFPAHALASAFRNLPLDSDQESQEARLPERGTELPATHQHP